MPDTITPDEQLLSDIKNYLHITWQDESTDNLITGYIKRGEARLQQIAGVSLDFTKEDLPRSLLFDYCRYANSQALEVFEKNFESELLELNLDNQFAVPEKLLVVSAAGTFEGHTKINASPKLDDGDSYVYKLGTDLSLPGYFDVCDVTNGYTAWNNESDNNEIEAAQGNDIVLVEVDENYKAIKAGKAAVIVR